MRFVFGLHVTALCALLCAACGDDEKPINQPFDSGAGGVFDSGSVAADAGGDQDSGAPFDSGTGADASVTDAGSDAGTLDAGALDSGAGDGGATDSGTADGDDANVIARSAGSWVVYPNPYSSDASVDGGPNPAADIQGSAVAVRAGDGGMTVTLNVSGLPAVRGFGSHVHKLACDTMLAGGHFQHAPFPDGGSATDPTFANPMNEVWLDFTTDDAGAATSSATVDFVPSDGGAQAIIVHDRLTSDGGVAGAKLACLPMPF